MQTLFRTGSAKLVCTELLTARLVHEIYHSRAQCLAAPVSPGAAASVGAIVVRGSVAQVAVAAPDHRQTVRGHLTFVEQSGTWRVDNYEDDFVRSSLIVIVSQPEDSGAFSSPALRACVVAKIPTMAISKLRTFFYALTRSDAGARNAAIEFASACAAPLSAFAAHQLMDGVDKQGKSPAQLRCIENQLTKLLMVTGLEKDALEAYDSSGATAAALAGLIRGATNNCT